MKLRKACHTVYKTQYHIVFVTKYRRKILTKGVSQWLRPAFEQLRKYSPDIEFIEMGIDQDHVHLHMVIPRKYAVSQVVNRIKVNTSRQMKQKLSFLEKVYWGTESVWSTGVLRQYGRSRRSSEAQLRGNAREGRCWTSGAWPVVGTPCVSAGDSMY